VAPVELPVEQLATLAPLVVSEHLSTSRKFCFALCQGQSPRACGAALPFAPSDARWRVRQISKAPAGRRTWLIELVTKLAHQGAHQVSVQPCSLLSSIVPSHTPRMLVVASTAGRHPVEVTRSRRSISGVPAPAVGACGLSIFTLRRWRSVRQPAQHGREGRTIAATGTCTDGLPVLSSYDNIRTQ
jgi:hypothetical protein